MKAKTLFFRIKQAIRRLEHGPHADPLSGFCGSDIVDRDEVLAAIDQVEEDIREHLPRARRLRRKGR